jgi:hypothetical protein
VLCGWWILNHDNVFSISLVGEGELPEDGLHGKDGGELVWALPLGLGLGRVIEGVEHHYVGLPVLAGVHKPPARHLTLLLAHVLRSAKDLRVTQLAW